VIGKNRFKVTRVRRVTGMSRKAVAALFSDRGKPRLVLITCGDRNTTTGVYRTRIIVNAKLLPNR
jgi:sortase (surface protein transpeptidase)